MSATVHYFRCSLVLLFFETETKTDLSSHVALLSFPYFAGILSAALSQHYLLEFEIAQLEFCHPY